ncbi:transcriptional regulator, DeoR family [Actinokineospora alba]|uniref:Transcriptional regulator, DeoR family n=1 Tax=Actinokineospora alba TaxID=504798 RepID=A0A1H0UX34_9PSEU|nr:DeoR/GlpR family DNA-binding transcription regulator [Actinokineospora alba]TDP69001.1 DeoR family transcriptional regulator [Actinokineospora alba]SDI77134.1 DeoR family transcriptional regulator, aga operon transcriptional repressor [Actinokineospora alba]SDP70747.1 transcriptional regulator, DeoR family [Actinokineospora alba]
MDRYERLSALLDLLGQSGKVDVEDLARDLDVSAATIRRDLDHLAEQQLLTRTRGGAVANNVAYDLPLRYKTARHASEKERIGKAAAALVSRGAVIGLNGGTTTTEIGRALAIRPDFAQSDEPGVTVVTNALNIANELAVRPHVKIVVTGGVARPQSFELSGPLATRILDEITLDIIFLGVDAVDPLRGAYAHHEGEASINRLMTQRARQVVCIADSSKLGKHAFAQICPTSAISILITDSEASAETVAAFEAEGVDVRIV